MDRIAELAAELVDEAMLRVRQGLGDSPIAYQAELEAQRAAKAMVGAAVEAAIGRYREAAKLSPDLTS